MSDIMVAFEEPGEPKYAVWYRYQDIKYAAPLNEDGHVIGSGSLEVFLHKIPVVKETPKGVWLLGAGYDGRNRFVGVNWRKRWACPTIEEAKVSFVARKRRQHGIHMAWAKRAERAIALIEGKGSVLDAVSL